jgi:hypothetical protein
MSKIPSDAKSTTIVLPKIDLGKMAEFIVSINNTATEIGERIQKVKTVVDEALKQHAPLITAIAQSISRLPIDFLTVQQALAERGWFVSPEITLNDFSKLKLLIDVGNFDALDKFMIQLTAQPLDETEANLCDIFPDRLAFIKEGFDNHRSGKYASAITLLLTQADGICADILGEIFFSINRSTERPAIKEKIDALAIDALSEITLHPILIKAGINASDAQVKRGEFPDSPHRHKILHGRSKDYASEINSLKIISFVGFMGGVLHPIVEEALTTSTAAPTPEGGTIS